jgi:Cof subfamily protein (haloacid dehalogenase superfamily)
MLIVDLDGTALTGDDRITHADRDAARALGERGVHVSIATGRLWSGTRAYAAELGVSGTVAVMNGSELVDVQTEEIRDGRYLDAASRSHARTVFASSGLSSFVYGSRRIHYSEGDERFMSYLGVWTPDLVRHRDVFDAPAWADDDVLAIAAAGDTARVLALRDALHDGLSADCQSILFTTFTGESFLKLRHGLEDKGTAVTRMAAERGVPVTQTVAIGDWTNDLPMLRTAGLSFAMADSGEDVRSAATHTLGSTRHAGGAVAEVAARVWGI